MKVFVLLSCVAFSLTAAMDIGAGGVYDSPMATDYYVRQFGFMFGGGRSGVFGLKALQESQDRFHILRLPQAPKHIHDATGHKDMVELEPVKVAPKTPSTPFLFHRFMAVP